MTGPRPYVPPVLPERPKWTADPALPCRTCGSPEMFWSFEPAEQAAAARLCACCPHADECYELGRVAVTGPQAPIIYGGVIFPTGERSIVARMSRGSSRVDAVARLRRWVLNPDRAANYRGGRPKKDSLPPDELSA